MEAFTYFVLVYMLILVPVLSWNIETRLPIRFSHSKDSYFGFTVALHNNSEGNFVLVAATKANSSLESRKTLHQPGILCKCDIVTTKCQEVVLQKTDIDRENRGEFKSYVSKEDDMWLGVSLDVQPTGNGDIVTCAHLWKNQVYEKHYLSNGACYVVDREFNSYKLVLPFLERELQVIGNIYLYAFGQAGTSAVFSERGDDLVLGAPGYYDWIGTVISYTMSGKPISPSSPVIPDPPGDQHPTPESYIGYSVTTGRFFNFEQQQFVTGAPRDGGNRGRVYIFESLHSNKRSIIVIQRFEGEKVGEYFGASVLGVDVNNDSYSDLLVGSPFYSLKSGGDEGKVYIYMSNGMGLQKSQEVMGSKTTESRFGTAIANAGDLNQDGYTDVAVGAPYEHGRGAVYIYHGSPNGILPNYAQKIAAESIDPLLSGFGISISRGKDVDDNYYPDLLIGSYLSDQAVLFRTRPVVQVYAAIIFDPPQINRNSSTCNFNNHLVPCFNVSFCLDYTGNYVANQLEISIELTSARKRDVLQARRYLMYQNKLSSYFRENVTIKMGQRNCFPNPAYVIGDSADFITPIQITLTFKLTHDVNSEETFCKSCPILDPRFSLPVMRTITFQTGCGEDSACLSDLRLKASVSSDKVIVGQTSVVTLAIELKNLKEPAYMSEIQISLPAELQIISHRDCRQGQSIHQEILCQAGNPLQTGHVAKFNVKFDTSTVSSASDYIAINVTATTASKEANEKDNQVKIRIPLEFLADIAIIGHVDVEQIILGKDQPDPDAADVTHVYTVLKFLPSPVSFVSVEILIPTNFSKSSVNFLQLKSIGVNEAASSPVPASCNLSQIDLRPESAEFEEEKEVPFSVLPTPRRKREINKRSVNNKKEVADAMETSVASSRGVGTSYILKCSNSACTKISCVAGPFTQKSTSATFRIYGFVNITSLRKVLGAWDTVSLVTEGKVKIVNPRENVQPKGHRPDEAKATTTIVRATPLPAKKIAFWIVAVSIACGVLLLVLIMLGMIKLGFFRRQKKEDMQKMMVKAELEEWEPYMVTDEEVENTKGMYESGTGKC